jgi:hypothetical protein
MGEVCLWLRTAVLKGNGECLQSHREPDLVEVFGWRSILSTGQPGQTEGLP